jgi:hypothetical protein
MNICVSDFKKKSVRNYRFQTTSGFWYMIFGPNLDDRDSKMPADSIVLKLIVIFFNK